MKKILALTLVLVTVLSVFAGCAKEESDAIVLPVVEVEDTVENRRQAAVEIAKSYWRKNPYVQYDNTAMTSGGGFKMGWRSQRDWDSTPEHASADLTVYTVCSSFTYDTAFQSVGVSIMGDRALCLTKDISKGSGIDEVAVVYQRTNDPNNMAENEAEAKKVQAMLQPGDIVNYFRYSGSGHSVLYVGDIDGDGKGDILHSDGKGFDYAGQTDRTESSGTILINIKRAPSADEFLFDPSFSEYLPKANYYAIVRPSALPVSEYPMTEPAKTRVLYQDMVTYFTCEAGYFGAVAADGELTYKLRVENHGKTDYKGLLLQIPAPQNAKIVKINGQTTTKQAVRFSADIPAGGFAEVTMTVVPTAGVGTNIVAEGGYVHTIPLPSITTAVQKASFTAPAVNMAIKNAAGKDGVDFVNAVWKTLDPNAAEVPAFDALLNGLFARKNVGENKLYVPKTEDADATLANMMVHWYFGGRKVITPENNNRVLTLRYQDLQPGDVLIVGENSLLDATYGVFDGAMMVMAKNGKTTSMLESQYNALLAKDFFVVLRPSQAQ